MPTNDKIQKGVLSTPINKEVLDMDLWIMSCRVLKRDMEFAMMDGLVARAKEKGLKKIKGYYYPTAKNNMVRDFYDRMGFSKVSEDAEGNTVWEFDLTKDYTDQNTHITVNP